MRIVVNKTNRPLKIHLPQGKVLHLGPRKEGQVTPHALDSPGVKRLIESGELEIVDAESHADTRGASDGAAVADTHGHHPNTTVHKRGDR